MKERSILFTGEMVRAILDGRKTQTRRLIKRLGKPCQYGGQGDRLWVKETFLFRAQGIIYRADSSPFDAAGLGGMYGGWKPSIFMPRRFSRITLEIVSVQPERLREMSNEDAQAEGIEVTLDEHSVNKFADLWDSINPCHPWKSNPWVWVISFCVV